MSTVKAIEIPDIGDFKNVEIIDIAVKVGDSLQEEDSILTLETDKAAMDIPAPFAGQIESIDVKIGDRVSQGTPIIKVMMVNGIDKEIPKPVETEPAPTVAADPTPPPVSAPSSQTLAIPDIGSETEVAVIEISVEVGDAVEAEQSLITLESEKASMDIPSEYDGIVEKILVDVGAKVKQGSPFIVLSTTAVVQEQSKPETQEVAKPVAPSTTAKTIAAPASLPAIVTSGESHAGPATRKLARELGVDLNSVAGSGRKGRIITKDVHTFVKQALSSSKNSGTGLGVEPMPAIDFSQFGEVETQALSRIKKISGKGLHRNWVTIPHVTQFDEADITDLELFRKSNKPHAEASGIKLTPIAFLIKAAQACLAKFPQFNASLSPNGEDLILKKYFNIGIAVDTPVGLLVPVMKEVNQKGLYQIAKELMELSEKAKTGKIGAKEMQGSSITISSLGAVGGTQFTPIINAPDVAILGISKAKIQPVFIDGEFVPRTILPFSLSYDHRVIDGVQAAKFTSYFSEQLKDIRKLLL